MATTLKQLKQVGELLYTLGKNPTQVLDNLKCMGLPYKWLSGVGWVPLISLTAAMGVPTVAVYTNVIWIGLADGQRHRRVEWSPETRDWLHHFFTRSVAVG